MKKTFYILLSIFLFGLFGILISALVQIPIIKLMISDFDKYSPGFTWTQLMVIHRVFSLLLVIFLAILGHKIGQKWWKYVYIDGKYKKN